MKKNCFRLSSVISMLALGIASAMASSLTPEQASVVNVWMQSGATALASGNLTLAQQQFCQAAQFQLKDAIEGCVKVSDALARTLVLEGRFIDAKLHYCMAAPWDPKVSSTCERARLGEAVFEAWPEAQAYRDSMTKLVEPAVTKALVSVKASTSNESAGHNATPSPNPVTPTVPAKSNKKSNKQDRLFFDVH